MKRKHFIGLLLIVVLGSVLRTWNAGAHGIWFDEKCSLLEANGISFSSLSGKSVFHNEDVKEFPSLKNVLAANISVDGGNGILYTLALHEWIAVFGPGDFSIRFISIFFGIALIILAPFFIIHLTGNRKLGFLSAFFIAVHPLLIAYSQQARSYSMATFFSFAASLFFLSIISKPDSRRPFFMYTGYVLCAVISLLSHYQSAYVFLGHAVIMLLFVREKKKWTAMFLVFLSVIVCMGIWYYSGGNEGLKVISSRGETYQSILRQNNGNDNSFVMSASLKNVCTGWLQVLLHLTGNAIQWLNFRIRFTGLLLIIPLLLLTLAIRYRKKITSAKIFFSLFILFLLGPAYATVLALVSGHIISFQPLYSIFSAPYAMILLAAGFIFSEEINKGWKRITVLTLGLSLTAILFISLVPVLRGTYINSVNVRKPNPYIHVADQLSKTVEAGDTIVFPSLIDAQLTNIYMSIPGRINQRVDTSFSGKFMLFKKNGLRIEIDDFQTKNFYY